MQSKNKPEPYEKGSFSENFRENPFRVPEGYFDSFHERLLERLDGESHNKPVPLLKIPRKLIAAAALVFVLLSIGTVVLTRYYMKTEPVGLPNFSLTLGDLEAIYGMDRFDEYTLVSFYLENTLEFQGEADIRDAISSDSNITNEDIQEYLIESNELENLLLNL